MFQTILKLVKLSAGLTKPCLKVSNKLQFECLKDLYIYRIYLFNFGQFVEYSVKKKKKKKEPANLINQKNKTYQVRTSVGESYF